MGIPIFWRIGTVLPSGCSSNTFSRWEGVIWLCPRLVASDWASATAS